MNPIYRLFATVDSFAPTILRLLLTAVFCVHGGQKTLGWMGGPGWSATLAHWTDPHGPGLSYPLVMIGILAEVAGAVGMMLGFLTRLAALAILCVMTMVITTVHWQAGFLASKGGYEYQLSLGVVALALLCCGGGRLSLDRFVTRHLLPPNTGTVSAYRHFSAIK